MTRRLSAWVVLSVAVHAGLVGGVLALAGVAAPPPMLLVDLVGGPAAADEPGRAERRGLDGGARRPGGVRERAAPPPRGPGREAAPAAGLESRPRAAVPAPEPTVPIPPVMPPSEPARPPVETPPMSPPPAPPEPAPVAEPLPPTRPPRAAAPVLVVPQPGPPVTSASPAPRATEPGAPSALAGGSRPAGTAKPPGSPGGPSGTGGAAPTSLGESPGRGGGKERGETAAGNGVGSGGGLALAVPGGGADAAEYGAYYELVRGRIHERLAYPSSARHRALSGTVEIEVEIAASGALGRIVLIASSSHSVLDDAALDAARGVRRVPFPPDVRPRSLRVRLPIVFVLELR